MKPLKIAIQKSGRLKDGSIELLAECGIKVHNGKDQLKVPASNFPMEVLFLRNSDIPAYVQDGVADIAIIGENTLIEKQVKVDTRKKLGFSKCRLSLAVPKDVEYTGDISFFEGKKIATSYVNTMKSILKDKGVNADVHEISGSVEIAPNIGLAEGICDLVSTGSTLFKNGLKEVEVLIKSEAVLISNPNLSAEHEELIQKLLFRIEAVLASKNTKYVLMNVPNEKIDDVVNMLPGMRSPSILPLAKEGWSSLHSVLKEDDFWNVIDSLKEAGAEGILVVPIEKLIS